MMQIITPYQILLRSATLKYAREMHGTAQSQRSVLPPLDGVKILISELTVSNHSIKQRHGASLYHKLRIIASPAVISARAPLHKHHVLLCVISLLFFSFLSL